jgi:O-antigen/teichoic acid export membrane protein
LVNLFSVCGRLLLVNFHPQQDVDVQFLIGQYHTACLFPLLLVSVGEMAASMLIPYLSKDWESGNREAVTERMNLMLKAIGLLCLAAAVGILLIAPLLFGGIWKDKFAVGESLLPMTLAYCSLIAMTFVAQSYFWCIEKTHYSSFNLLLGLVVNLGLGLVLVGRFGIAGVVGSTLLAHVVVLTGIFVLCRRHGLKFDSGVFLIAAALLAIAFGKGIALLSLIILLLVGVLTEALLDSRQKQAVLSKLKSLGSTSFGIDSA